jgi:hypothetical protein
VIEESETGNEEEENNSITSTNNELLSVANKISKKDEEEIFESRESYCNFIDNYRKKIYLRTGLFLSLVLKLGAYIGLFFILRMSYENVIDMFNSLSTENAMIGEIAACQNILLQTEYRIRAGNTEIDEYLL